MSSRMISKVNLNLQGYILLLNDVVVYDIVYVQNTPDTELSYTNNSSGIILSCL